MRGVITGRDVVRNLAVICREFGLGCALRCVLAALRHGDTTFLARLSARAPLLVA